ncbi:hypothetical protein DM02DRAFT_571441 [Periconia macrospinosa]|uniref:Rhodopsin domain-containing protein n=1 Tax=Periconia macrospinosa TaxID=97972 RepID=A0A2V1DAY3_9PLEO|nr:hypothetical protein DM02DRAFT_571441 [Periconia macrospinosa]
MVLGNNPRGQQAVQVSGAFTGIAFFVVLLRLFTRFHIVRCAGVEDYLVGLSMLCSIGLTICIGIQAQYGMGRHIADLQPQDMEHSLQAFYASLIVYYLSLGLTKTSILLQYQRIFRTRSFRIACWAIMAVTVIYAIWTLFGSIFVCFPIRAFWTKEQPSKCINQMVMWFTNAGFNILTDFAIIVLPMPVIRSLNLARRQKQALIGIFAVGFFVCVVSILRLHSLVAISNSSDPTYDNPPAATWSSVEINVGITCSCLPCLRPLITRWFHGVLSSTPYRYNGRSGGRSFSRNAYHLRSVGAGTILPLDSKGSRVSSEGEVYGAQFQVGTEGQTNVDRNDTDCSGIEKECRIQKEGSTSSLTEVHRQAV